MILYGKKIKKRIKKQKCFEKKTTDRSMICPNLLLSLFIRVEKNDIAPLHFSS